MTIAFAEYQIHDWLRLRPFTHSLKAIRYARKDLRQLSRRPKNQRRVDLVVSELRSTPKVLTTIAFNDPQLIEWQIRSIQRWIPEVEHFIVDNSNQDDAADRIQKICSNEHIKYLRIDSNPWNGRHFSRSHGFAMNWAWRHVLRPAAPDQFGFLDHDLIPTRPTDPFADLANLPFYGDKRQAGQRWFLWAGYCMFQYRCVASIPLDFGLDWFIGLDTGGANWARLYRTFDPLRLRTRKIRKVHVWDGIPTSDAYFEWRDDWIHEVGLDGRRELHQAKRLRFSQIVEEALQSCPSRSVA